MGVKRWIVMGALALVAWLAMVGFLARSIRRSRPPRPAVVAARM